MCGKKVHIKIFLLNYFFKIVPEAVELSPGESNTTAISATWTVPDSVVDTFNITCSNGTASPASIPVDRSQGGQQLTAYCVGLPRSGEQYDLSVVAISNDKLSAISTVEVFALPLGVDLKEGPSTLTSVSVSWMRQNDTVESYSIMCSHGYASPSTIGDTDRESFSAACVNLIGPGATYSMTVYSEVGTNSSSNSTRASSLINLVAVPESVESIAVTEPTTTTVDVQWNLVQCSDCVYNYFLLTFKPDSQEPIRVDYTPGVNEYSSQVSNLTQGRSYNFTVVSVSGVGVQDATLKTSEEKSVDQRTVPATPFGLSILSSQRELNLVWGYQGDADNFAITVTPDHGIAVFNGDFTDPAAEITGLTPGIIYFVAVVTESGDERSEPITQTARTVPDKPSPVRNPRAEAVDKNTITLTYESPVEPNGDITSYMISYVGTRDDNPSHEFSDVYSPPVLAVTYNDLYPGFSYTFMIIAVNDGEYESDPVSTEPVETPQEEPPPVPEDYPYEANTDFSDTSTTSFAVVLPDDLFSHDNGELLTFAVIITKEGNDPTVGSTEQNYEEARAQNAYITAIDVPYPFPPTFGSNRKRRATDPSATVVIGDGTCAGSPKEYCNGRLDDNTQYYYAFRAFNDMGGVTSGTFGPVKTECTGSSSPNIVSYGAQIGLIVVVVALLLYAVAITFLHIRRKVPIRTEENGPDPYMDLTSRPEADTTYQEMDITSTASSKRPGERRAPSSHLIYENQNVAQFANKIKGDADYETVLTPN
ncbi:fibronectin [Strongylocentrotus purpuratus]|uniref:protein-tyrosine-phosphatase n=1 Tax=Strongylocentrotus purpuratus TaxID=7668 RepID=A0A7M7T077_STRPU|nr:fibronectin [Strongylocentrotus purpuratus]